MGGAQRDGDRRRRLGVGAALVLVLAAAATSVAIGMLRTTAAGTVEIAADAPTSSAVPAPPESGDPRAPTLYVHVAGAVSAPGLYRLDDGARVLDAVAAAGGFTLDADRTAVNLARPIADGEQLFVPTPGQTSSGAAGAGAEPAASASEHGATGGPIHLNSADSTALEELPGIGPALAGRIIAWREEHGPFTAVDDLLAVPGIGDKLLAGLRELVVV